MKLPGSKITGIAIVNLADHGISISLCGCRSRLALSFSPSLAETCEGKWALVFHLEIVEILLPALHHGVVWTFP